MRLLELGVHYQGVRVLFSVRNPSYVRHYESVLRLLASRGHEVDLVTERPEHHSWTAPVERLAEEFPTIRLSLMPALARDPWFELATRLRQARFYLRFLDEEYAGMPALLARARSRAPLPAIRLAEFAGVGRRGRHLLARAINVLERATGTARSFHGYLREMRPDVVVSTPLVVLKTTQLDFGRAAIELGVRNVFAVASWDNLSSKGELTFAPQHVVVWNEVQRREAGDLHQIDTIAGDRDRRPGLRRLVRATAVDQPRGVLRPRRASRRSADRALRLLGPARGQPARAAFRRAVGPPPARERPRRACASATS